MRVRMIARLNFPLIIGICIALILLAVSLYPERFASSDPYGKETLQYEKNSGRFLLPPVPPGEDYKWGSDEKGRDLQSLIVYGCRATIMMALSVALGRLLIALPFAVAAAYKSKIANGFIRIFHVTFSAFPQVMIVLLLSRIKLFQDFLGNPMNIAMIIMAFFGWSKLAGLLKKSIEDVLNQEFIEGEIAIGKTKLEIALQNVIPHIIPSIVVLFFLEVAFVLLLLSQVGVLGLVLSSGYVNDELSSLNVPYEFDWASLLVFSYYLFNMQRNWLVVYPALAFAISIIGFNLLGEGLRLELEKRDSRIIQFIKKIPSFLSPLRLVYELKSFKTYKKSALIKLTLLTSILLVILFPQPQSKTPFQSVEAFATVNEVGSSFFQFREYETGRNVIAMNYLANKLEEYGVQPFDNKYVHEMATLETPEIADPVISYINRSGERQNLNYKKDYILAEPIEGKGSFEIDKLNLSKLGDYKWLINASGNYQDKVLLVDGRGMEYRQLNSITTDIRNFLKPAGVIFIEDWNSSAGRGNSSIYQSRMGNIFTILMASDKGEALLQQEKATLDVQINIKINRRILYANVMGIIPGKDEKLKDDIILIGSSLNEVVDNMGKGNYQALKAGGVATELQLAKMLAAEPINPDRTVIFAFWDDSIRFNKGAQIFTEQYIDRSKNDIFYIDIGNLEGDKLIIDSSGIRPKNKKGQSYVRNLKASLARNDIDAVFRSINNSATGTFISNKQEVLAFDSGNLPYTITTKEKEKTMELTAKDLVKFHKIGQMIVDTVFDIIYDKRVK